MRGTLLRRRPTILPVVMGGRTTYTDKVKAIFGSDLIGYWTCEESTGTTATDKSPAANDGTYSGVTLAQPGIGDGKTCMYLDGSSGYLNIYTIAGEFDPTKITLTTWVKDEVWDATLRYVFRIRRDNSNYVVLYRADTGQWVGVYRAGGTSNTCIYTPGTAMTDWVHLGLTVDVAGNSTILYVNGVAVDTDPAAGTWAGALTSSTTVIGNSTTGAAANVWHGWLAHLLVARVVATPDQMALLATR